MCEQNYAVSILFIVVLYITAVFVLAGHRLSNLAEALINIIITH